MFDAQLSQIRGLLRRSRDDHEWWFGAAATLSARNSLRITQSDFKYIACGYPVPIRLHWASSGGWKGVAALSKHPTRAQPVGWDDGIKHSSRALVTSSLVQNMWITAGTIYGETAGTWHPHQLQKNNRLLSAVATHVCLYSTGLRVVAGDFNLQENDVQAFSVLENSSFRDLQAIAADRWGVSIQNTCTSAPPHPGWLLLHHQSRAPGHAAIHWTPAWCMARSHNHSRAFSWSCSRCPQVCLAPATAYGVAKVWCSRSGCCEARVSHCQFSSVLARCWVGAVAASPKYYPQSQSRPCHCGVVCGRTHAPLKSPGAGDIEPNFFGVSLQHANWSRQARRLQSVRFAKAARPGVDPRHAAKVWGAIQRARGLNRALVSGGKNAHSKLPSIPQHGVIAQHVYDCFVLALRHLAEDLMKTSKAKA